MDKRWLDKKTYFKVVEVLGIEGRHRMCNALCTICKNVVKIRLNRVQGDEQASCGCAATLVPKKDVSGVEINGVLFVGYKTNGVWRVRYSCGHYGDSLAFSVKAKRTTLCNSCSKALPTTTTHGMVRSKEYMSWQNMMRRCYSPSNNRSEYYKERGILVCDRWNLSEGGSFENFYEDMGLCPKGYSLERLDLNGNYSPDNCMWADDITQANNKSNNILIENLDGESWSLRRWCEILGKDYKRAWHQLKKKGLPIESILGDGFKLKEVVYKGDN